jgi:glycosyltransferase involved in cell wall biosynthesis
MRIAVIGTRGHGSAGAAITLALNEICPRLARRGHQIDIFSERNGRAIGGVAGARVIALPRVATGLGDASSHAMMSSVVAACRFYDVVNYCAVESGGLFSLISKLGLHRTVVTVHALDRPLGHGSLFSADALAARLANAITVVSRRLERHFLQAYGRSTIYIPNGTGLRQGADESLLDSLGLGLRHGSYLLLADRPVPDSGYHLAIAAVNSLPDGMRLVVAETGEGDADYARHLRQSADPTKVLFAGHCEQRLLDVLVDHAHLFLLPSLAEEAPSILVEALARGRAVVVSDQSEHLDIVGAEAFTFTSGDAGDLRRVLSWLTADSEVVARMELRAAAAAAERFSWDRIATAYEQVFASVL